MIKEWRDVKGYEGRYEVSNEGDVRRLYKHCKRLMTPYVKKTSNNKRIIVKLTDFNGKSKECTLANIVAQAFLECPDMSYRVVHKNGIQTDNYVQNLQYMSMSEIGKRYGASSNRIPVAKIDKNGEVVEFYSSARESARKNYMSYQTIIDRCNGKCKSLFAPDGFAYCWDEDKDINKITRRILENGKKQKSCNAKRKTRT